MVAALLAAVPPERLERLAAYALEWLAAGDPRLRRAACQVGRAPAGSDAIRGGPPCSISLVPPAALTRMTRMHQ